MSDKLKGGLSILASAILFYLATFFVKLGNPAGALETLVYTASRFWIGYFAIIIWILTIQKTNPKKLKVVNRKWLWYRAFWNLIAVIFFYLGVTYGTVTGANIINMTYPVFVALFSIYILNEKSGPAAWLAILLSIIGSTMVSFNHEGYHFSSGVFFAFLSAITAGIAIVALRKIRQTDSTEAALYFNFKLGFWVMLAPLFLYIYHGDYKESTDKFIFPVLSGLSGILGQAALTYGFKYVSAVHGSILSASRLVFAVILGWMFFHTEISIYSVTGAVLILMANILFSFKK
jgi:drug/metabolite transporter (DMT)-like permease